MLKNISLNTPHTLLNQTLFHSRSCGLRMCTDYTQCTTTHTLARSCREQSRVLMRAYTINTQHTKPYFFSTFSFAATLSRLTHTSDAAVLKLFLGQRTDLHSFSSCLPPRACNQRESCLQVQHRW